MTKYIVVGTITNTHGIHGGLLVQPHTYDITRYEEYGTVYLGDDKLTLNIVSVRYHKNRVLLYFEGFDNINDVLNFKNQYLYITSSQKKELPKGTYYIHDILNCDVYSEEDIYVGKVIDIYTTAANPVYEIEYVDKVYSIPAVKEFIKDINIEQKRITIKLMEGLLDED